MAKLKASFYNQSTAKFYRKLGDTILFASTGVSTMCMALPVEETTKTWVIFCLGLFGMLGKTITNLFTDTETNE